MATSAYLSGRKRYARPQGVLWSDNAGTLSNGIYVPNGYEVGADYPPETPSTEIDQFLIFANEASQLICYLLKLVEFKFLLLKITVNILK